MKPPFFMELGRKPTKTLGSAIAEGKVNRMDDLISRDKLIINMNDTKANAMHMFQFPKEQINVAEAVADAMIYNVSNAPAVDSVPVVHGHWIERFTGNEYIVFCSNCNYEATEMVDYHLEYNYCPHCGAKMDEDGEQE